MSGINSADTIEQLMAIEAWPVRNLEARVATLEIQRTAFLDLAAKILAVKNAASQFGKLSFFRSFSALSTNDAVITASAGETAAPGSHTLRVHSLVANHSVISRGFMDAESTPVGVGSLSIEVGHGRVDRGTELNNLNGGTGLRRGIISITDRSGASADIDLSTAMTIDDLLEAINSNTGISVRASVTGLSTAGGIGDRIVVEDLTGETASNLIIAEVAGGFTAADLGLVSNVAADRVEGGDLVRLSMSTPLTALNDGNGVDRLFDGPDLEFRSMTDELVFAVSLTDQLALQTRTDLRALNGGNGVRLGTIRITDRSGGSAEVNLSEARTAQDVWDLMDTAVEETGLSVSINIVNSHFLITDTSDVPDQQAGSLIVEDVEGFAAADLGIAACVDQDSILGRDVYRIATLGDVINAINYAPDNGAQVRARISDDGNGIVLEAAGLDNTLVVRAGADAAGYVSHAARDLGILDARFSPTGSFASRHLIAGLNTVLLRSLNGGRGVDAGTVSIDGATIDFAGVQTLQDVIDRINDPGNGLPTSVQASVNAAGNGIVIRDEAGEANTTWLIDDLSGSLAADLGIAVGTAAEPFFGEAVDSGNAQLQYVSRRTLLEDLNGGRGVQLGAMRIIDSLGAVHVINLGSANITTMGGVIDRINAGIPETLEARINETGDGIAIVDTAGGGQPLTVEDIDGGRAAADLRLAGTAKPGENLIDGSYEIKIRIDAGDTLNDVMSKLNEAGGDFRASVFNDGGSINPFSLTVTSAVSGRKGEMMLDTSGVDLGFSTLARAADAVVGLGGGESSGPLLVSSRTNTLDQVIEGVTFNLLSAGDQEVKVTVSQNVDEMVDAINAFVSAYNEVQSAIDSAISFNPDTEGRGPLLGDRTVEVIRNRLYRVMMHRFDGVPEPFPRLFSVGMRIGADNCLEFEEQDFRDAYTQSPALVERLFTQEDIGLGAVLQDALEELTRDFDGVLARKDDLLAEQEELLNDQIERLNLLLEAKRARLEAQFVGLESAIAALQGQQDALATLGQLLGA